MPGSNIKRKQAPVSDKELLVHGSNGQESSHDTGDSTLRAKRAHIEANLAALNNTVPPSGNDAETEDLKARRASTHEKYNTLKTYKGQYYSSIAVGQRDREIDLLEDVKRRILELPLVLASEKVKVTNEEKGQQKLDDLLRKTKD
ncbi:hypothetical protein Purlil1_10313 [Purpureocillium lilacinum]|uniref:Uncharacterized protein n=1 Tax=Purpureocillium lilacinum TaxID=33203 RepID=A0ABR0BN15_PURLI|nr:hypothetical protein Purlil1_10313 [Purpureocillium lilacinum]